MSNQNELEHFKTFAKSSKNKAPKVEGTNVVIYTRVSSKEQADKNLSLETQLKAIDEYAQRNNLKVQAYFGGTFESAKSDGRKEFMRMMEYIIKHKGQIKQLLVYTIDRFSRTGGGAIKLTTDLRDLYGVNVLAITQPTDTTNPTGVFSQNMQLLISQYDNDLRKLKCVAGMKHKFEKGIWALKPPRGYDVVKINGERNIVINKDAKFIKTVFEMKDGGAKNEEIIAKLGLQRFILKKNSICDMLANPFYCGLISCTLLEGKIVEGKHKGIVSKELFLRVNNISQNGGKYGVPHKKEDNNIPLKVFIKCENCNTPYTGYIVKAKKLYYYKCRKKGCACNISATKMHQLFEELLSKYVIKESSIPLFQKQLVYLYNEVNNLGEQNLINLKSSLTELNTKIDRIEDNHYVLNEMNKETFQKFNTKFQSEKLQIVQEIENRTSSISNHEECIKSVLQFSSKLNTEWHSGNVSMKEKIQKIIFPEGIHYSKQNHSFRTTKVNDVFSCIAHLQSISAENKKRTNRVKNDLSAQVAPPRIELGSSV
jgi:site-specific DNA recombinase